MLREVSPKFFLIYSCQHPEDIPIVLSCWIPSFFQHRSNVIHTLGNLILENYSMAIPTTPILLSSQTQNKINTKYTTIENIRIWIVKSMHVSSWINEYTLNFPIISTINIMRGNSFWWGQFVRKGRLFDVGLPLRVNIIQTKPWIINKKIYNTHVYNRNYSGGVSLHNWLAPTITRERGMNWWLPIWVLISTILHILPCHRIYWMVIFDAMHSFNSHFHGRRFVFSSPVRWIFFLDKPPCKFTNPNEGECVYQ